MSDVQTVSVGVPQGTVLGPILFILYVNDLPNAVNNVSTIMYADDTIFICCGTSAEEVNYKMNACLRSASKWFKDNKLVLNTSKSNVMVVGTRQKIQKYSDNVHILLENTELVKVTDCKLLGIVLGQYLSFDQHVEYLVNKASQKIGLLHRLRHTLDTVHLNIVYKAIVQSLFDYCLTVWGNCSSKNMNTIQKLQNRAARAVTGIFDYSVPSFELLCSLNWTTIDVRFKYFVAILMYKCVKGLAPIYLSDKFQYLTDVHSRTTRNVSNDLLYLPKPSTEMYKRSFLYSGANIWNSLDSATKQSTTLLSFKELYKSCLT